MAHNALLTGVLRVAGYVILLAVIPLLFNLQDSPLHRTAFNDHDSALQALVAAGADLNARNVCCVCVCNGDAAMMY